MAELVIVGDAAIQDLGKHLGIHGNDGLSENSHPSPMTLIPVQGPQNGLEGSPLATGVNILISSSAQIRGISPGQPYSADAPLSHGEGGFARGFLDNSEAGGFIHLQ